MIEYSTWGVVLNRTRDDELDTEYSIFTWDLGKVNAKAVSVRKMTSKLAGHLEPGTLARLRFVQKAADGNFKITEALMEEKTKDPIAVKALVFADQMTPLLQVDLHLFAFLKDVVQGKDPANESRYYRKILALLGLDPSGAACAACGGREIAYFIPQDIMFLCHRCLQKAKETPRPLKEETRVDLTI